MRAADLMALGYLESHHIPYKEVNGQLMLHCVYQKCGNDPENFNIIFSAPEKVWQCTRCETTGDRFNLLIDLEKHYHRKYEQ